MCLSGVMSTQGSEVLERKKSEELLNASTHGGCGGSSFLWDIFPCALSANIRSIPGRGLEGWGDL